MKVQAGLFKLGVTGREDAYLSGNYEIKTIANKSPPKSTDYCEHIEGQLVYDIGHVLYRTDTDGINDMIDLFIRYTKDPCTDLDLDFFIKNTTVFVGGTICPAKKVLFAYMGKVYVAFGRYIFGYDKSFEILNRHTNEADQKWTKSPQERYTETCAEDFDACLEERPDTITNDEIVLNRPPEGDGGYYEYVYSFMIYDQNTKVLDAFGLYW